MVRYSTKFDKIVHLKFRAFALTNPTKGQPLGKNCYKIRMSISSKNKGKSGGARVITLVQIIDDLVVLLSIYDKSEKETVSDSELDDLINDFNAEEES